MQSVRDSAARHLRIQAPLTVRSVAAELGVSAGSTLDLVGRLQQHRTNTTSGSLLPSSVKGSATLEFTSDGFWSYRGHVHENSFVPHNWVLVAVPHVVDENGTAFAFTAQGKVTDDRDSDFAQNGFDPRISAHYDQLAQAAVTFKLDVNVNVGHLIGDVFELLSETVLPIALIVVWVSANGPVERRENPDGSVTFVKVLK
jgi:hypothetical protein